MKITLGGNFERNLLRLATKLARTAGRLDERMKLAMERIQKRWVIEAKRRVPVETDAVRKDISGESGAEKRDELYYVACFTDVDRYPKYIEFGTTRIAKGKVLALGKSPRITDEMAIHTWPAKRGDATSRTSAGILGVRKTKAGYFTRTLYNRKGKTVPHGTPGRPQEQMPWLRPSWMAIEEWAVEQITKALLGDLPK